MEKVVVVGAGITGCFTAYLLAERGVPVTLIDPDGPGQQASGQNPGGLNPFHGPGIPGPSLPLAQRSFRLHWEHQDRIARLAEERTLIRRVSRIELAFDDEERAAAERMMKLYEHAEGFSARWLDRTALAVEEPRCAPEAVGGLLMEGNGAVESQPYTEAVCRAAQRLGATFVQARVKDLERSGTRVSAAITDCGNHVCTSVVLATGPWMKEPESWLGLNLPVTPLKGELLRAVLPGVPLRHHITNKTAGIYLLPKGEAWLGGTQDHDGYDTLPTAHGRNTILDQTTRLVPSLKGCRILRHRVALRPVTPDGLPILGRVSGWENVYVASGAGPKGMLLGPGLAESIVKWILNQTRELDLEPFAVARFNCSTENTRNEP